MKLFAGTSNAPLAEAVAKELGVNLSKAEVIRFHNSEVRVQIQEDVENETCVVLQSTANPTDTNIMELFFFCDALKRQQAKKVYAVIPYFGYARQNIQHRDGECVSVNVVISFLESIGFDKVFTLDLHERATEGVFSIPFKHLTAVELLADKMKDVLAEEGISTIDPSTVAIVSPDQGGINLARHFGEYMFNSDDFSLAVVEKQRSYNKVHESISLGLHGDVSGKVVVIADDMVTSGGTLTQAAELCEKNGAKAIFSAATHPDFGENVSSRIDSSAIQKLIVTDTIVPAHPIESKKVTTVSVAKLLADELRLASD